MEKMQRSRVSDTVKKFRGLIDYWDVMNEPSLASSEDNALGRWIKIRTPETVTNDALAWASCTESKLIVNDYNVSNNYLSILKGVIQQGGHLDAIGIQSHMHTGVWRLNYIWDICNRFGQLGVPLQFTEVTVLSGAATDASNSANHNQGWGTTNSEGEALQANYTKALYTLLFSHPSVESITWWDLSDLNSWQGAPSGLLRGDMSPKPAYNQLMKLIHSDWWTHIDISSSSDGKAKWRGFYGLYRLTIESGNRKVTTNIHLAKGSDNVFMVKLP
jgi:GH35 family endo-1,4-beta-xylanase